MPGRAAGVRNVEVAVAVGRSGEIVVSAGSAEEKDEDSEQREREAGHLAR